MENKDIILKGMADVVQSTEGIIEEAALYGSKNRDPQWCWGGAVPVVRMKIQRESSETKHRLRVCKTGMVFS